MDEELQGELHNREFARIKLLVKDLDQESMHMPSLGGGRGGGSVGGRG